MDLNHQKALSITRALCISLLLLAALPRLGAAQTCSARCPDGSTSAIYDCDNPPAGICGGGRGSSDGGTNNAWFIEQQQRAAAAELKRKQLEEEEKRRKELEEEGRREKERKERLRKEKEAKFLHDRDTTVLKGTFGGNVVILKDTTAPESPEKGGIADGGGQLKSADYHSGVAKDLPGEGSKREAGKGFDEPGANQGSLVYPAGNAGLPGFASKIPRYLRENDREIKTDLDWYRQLDKLKQETDDSMTRVKEQQKKGGNRVALAAQLAALKNRNKQYSADQAKVVKKIKKRVIDLGIAWDEEKPDSAQAGKTGKTGKTGKLRK